MTHGYKLREGMLEGVGVVGGGRQRGEKEWDNCNSIINKIYLKKNYGTFRLPAKMEA